MDIYTAQYRYVGPDRLDITVSNKNTTWGRAFAPTWDMVMGHKNHTLSDDDYTEQYCALMHTSLLNYPEHWKYLASLERVVLVCFCVPNAFCHRVILANIVKLTKPTLTTYHGEIQL